MKFLDIALEALPVVLLTVSAIMAMTWLINTIGTEIDHRRKVNRIRKQRRK